MTTKRSETAKYGLSWRVGEEIQFPSQNPQEVLRDPEGGDGGWGNEERRKAILLLTDGVPNREPNHGYVEGIRNYMD